MLNMDTPERKPANSTANKPRVTANATTILEKEVKRRQGDEVYDHVTGIWLQRL